MDSCANDYKSRPYSHLYCTETRCYAPRPVSYFPTETNDKDRIAELEKQLLETKKHLEDKEDLLVELKKKLEIIKTIKYEMISDPINNYSFRLKMTLQ